MGKTVTYAATAILLGIVAMLPVIVLTPRGADPSHYAFSACMRAFKGDVERLPNAEEVGSATVPSSPFHTGLILAFSFFLALGVCLYFKRRMF